MNIFRKKTEEKQITEQDLINVRKRYELFLKELDKSKNQFLTNGNKEWAIILLKEMFRNTKKVVRIFCNNDNLGIWEDKQFIDFINDIITEKNIILNIATTNRMFFDKLFNNNSNVFISNVTANGLRKIYDHFRNEHCTFAVFDDKGFRYEYDTKETKSYANFNHKEVADILINLFEESII